eukprot:2643367-Alexandrium_andersonii.AAC.1
MLGLRSGSKATAAWRGSVRLLSNANLRWAARGRGLLASRSACQAIRRCCGQAQSLQGLLGAL